MKYSKNKKGDLSLSINAIVILILAITMLGLGLAFITGMFGRVSTDFEAQAAKEPEPSPATETNPISLSRESVIGNKGDTKVLKISVFCEKATIGTVSGCVNPTLSLACDPANTIDITPPKNTIQPKFGTVGYFSTKTGIMQFKLGADAQTGVCTVTAAGVAGATPTGELELGVEHIAQFVLTVK